jgi:hypothetical protein
MKLRASLTALALVCGTAFAAQNDTGATARDAAAGRSQAAAASTDTRAPNDGIVEKTKREIRRMGEKLGNATHRSENASTERDPINEQAARNEARTMGAAGSDQHDPARRSRMDSAYENWKSKQRK